MAQFVRQEQTVDTPTDKPPFTVKSINQATQLNTDDWSKFSFGQVNGIGIRSLAVGVEAKINEKTMQPINLNPGDYFPGKINTLWLRNTETFPSSLDNEQLILALNPLGGHIRSLAPLLKDIFQNRYNYGSATNTNALIVELDTGLYGGSPYVEMWADIKSGYDANSTPMISIYSSVSPLEDGTTITGADGFRFMEWWNYEDELAKTDSAVINSKDFFHITLNNAYRYIYLSIDFGEDSGNDLYGDCEIELTSSR